MLAQRAEEVARHLLPAGKKESNKWCVGSINGEAGKSLKIHLTGEKAGIWCDFAIGDAGDLIDLWALNRNILLRAALKEAQEYLGISQPKFEGHKQKKFIRPSVNITSITSTSPVMNYLINQRKLTIETINTFKVGENKREIVFPYVRDNDLISIKYLGLDRPDGKKQMRVEANCEPCLFGWQALSSDARNITLTEGEIDTMSLHQYGIAALSVPFGAGAGKKQEWLEYEFDRLAAFDEITLCFDPDAEGKAAIAELLDRLGRHRCRIVELPYKDPNECLQNGVSKEIIKKCFDEARTLDPEELKPANYFVDQVIAGFNPPNGCEVGIAPPWEKVKDKILFRPAELSIWSGINGHGKSQFLGHLILHFIMI